MWFKLPSSLRVRLQPFDSTFIITFIIIDLRKITEKPKRSLKVCLSSNSHIDLVVNVSMYKTINQSVRVLRFAPWYSVEVLFAELNAVRAINFSIVEQRQQALERLGNMRREGIMFNFAVRFAAEGDYVCESLGDWPRKFQQLRAALSYKERDLRGNMQDKEQTFHFQSSQDALVAFQSATTSMMDQIVRADGIWDQEKFERYHSLYWNEDKESHKSPRGLLRKDVDQEIQALVAEEEE